VDSGVVDQTRVFDVEVAEFKYYLPELVSADQNPRELYDTHLQNFHSHNKWHHNSRVVWSMSSVVVIGLFTPFHLPKTKHNLPFVKRAILWDAPSIGFGIPPTPTGKLLFRMETFIDFVTAFCIYPE
jgi:hypothetical protein